MVFIVAVLLRPEVQTMAQEELDAVTKGERLPTFEDRLKLPFVDAICKEVVRWKPVGPLSELLPSNRQRKRYDGSQIYPMQRRKMMSTVVSSSPRVCTLGVRMYFTILLICIYRCGGDDERMVRNLPYPLPGWRQHLLGRSFTTQSCTQIQIPSSLNGSSTPMEACVMIRY
jgi:hypothetical protein